MLDQKEALRGLLTTRVTPTVVLTLGLFKAIRVSVSYLDFTRAAELTAIFRYILEKRYPRRRGADL